MVREARKYPLGVLGWLKKVPVGGKHLMCAHLSSPCCSGSILPSHTLYYQKEMWFWFSNPGTGVSEEMGIKVVIRESLIFRQAT